MNGSMSAIRTALPRMSAAAAMSVVTCARARLCAAARAANPLPFALSRALFATGDDLHIDDLAEDLETHAVTYAMALSGTRTRARCLRARWQRRSAWTCLGY